MSTLKKYSGYFLKCEWCGKDIYKTKTEFNRHNHHFCSNKCQLEYQHSLKFEYRECEICHELFECNKKSKQRFCSQKCQGKWQSSQTGLLNPRNRLINYKCENCGKEGLMKRKQFNAANHHFCSDRCRNEWLKANVYCTEEWSKQRSKIAVQSLADGNLKKESKPQIIINNLLDEINISYVNEKSYEYYSVDNYLCDFNLIIEVMGDYWHTNPFKYSSDKINNTQQNRIYKDKTKQKYIYNNFGIRILYLWESDIYNNLTLCKNLIIKYIENNGNISNYHSFNYHLDDNNLLLLNKTIITPYFELENNINNVVNA